jgi:hypothetical protein
MDPSVQVMVANVDYERSEEERACACRKPYILH